VTFQTVYPGWYAGRITHIHFEVFLQSAVTQGAAKATSQIAFPPAVTTAVYASSLYAARGQNTSVTSFAQDGIFADGTEFQLATVTGDTTSGYLATLSVGVAAG
jgi:protocatechuate 3,4-dioxygenase beta subunit